MIVENGATVSFPQATTSPTEAPTAGADPSKPQQKRDKRKKLQLAAQKRLEARRQGPQAAAAAPRFAVTSNSTNEQRITKKPRHSLTDLEKRRKKQAKRAARRLKKEFFLDLEKVTAGMAGLGRAEEEEARPAEATRYGMGMELDA
ncbi:hypothetical protein RB599_005924 [Gaeumannomyces hyphopodioides]